MRGESFSQEREVWLYPVGNDQLRSDFQGRWVEGVLSNREARSQVQRRHGPKCEWKEWTVVGRWPQRDEEKPGSTDLRRVGLRTESSVSCMLGKCPATVGQHFEVCWCQLAGEPPPRSLQQIGLKVWNDLGGQIRHQTYLLVLQCMGED